MVKAIGTKINHGPVTNCKEAAMARGIKLKQELKTIVLDVNGRKIAIHIRGCDRIDIRAVKKIFRHKNICFANENFLSKYNLATGLINPWNIPFCTYQLVCLKVFQNRFMGTNNSCKTEGVLFQIDQIFDFNNLILGYFGI